jgi:hypothetical protein
MENNTLYILYRNIKDKIKTIDNNSEYYQGQIDA